MSFASTEANLTPAQQSLFDWAVEGVRNACDDPDFVRDNPDILTDAGARDDMRYRLEIQADDMADNDATPTESGARRRVIRSTVAKLDRAKYFTIT